jgi:acetyl esterase/lipase
MADIPLADLKDRLRRQRDLGAAADLATMRAAMDAAAARTRLDPGVSVSEAVVGRCPGEWLRPDGANADSAILYLHGGGFVGGSCVSHRPMVSALARASGCNAFVAGYRLAPEHPWPAAELDAFDVYSAMLESGIASERIAIAGDSAGGNLVVTTLLRARDARLPMPACAVLFSPWIDLDLNGESIRSVAAIDPTLRAEGLANYARLYRDGAPGPKILDSDLSRLPPLLIQAGGDEILRDDAVRLQAKLAAAGVDVTLEIGEGMFHVWQAFGPWLPQARDAIARAAAFIAAEAKR